MFQLVDNAPAHAVIKVIGVGGGGGNAVQHMLRQEVDGVEFVCANTDAQALQNLASRTVLQLGSIIFLLTCYIHTHAHPRARTYTQT